MGMLRSTVYCRQLSKTRQIYTSVGGQAGQFKAGSCPSLSQQRSVGRRVVMMLSSSATVGSMVLTHVLWLHCVADVSCGYLFVDCA